MKEIKKTYIRIRREEMIFPFMKNDCMSRYFLI
jgi:hypothetical protein